MTLFQAALYPVALGALASLAGLKRDVGRGSLRAAKIWAFASAAWLALFAYGGAWPRSSLFGPVLYRGDPAAGAVALTFDDGPNEPATSRLLDLLKEQNVRATFFLIGQNASAFPDTVRRIAAEGHEIGNHSYTHLLMAAAGRRSAEAELDLTQRTLAALSGREPTLFRPPFGLRDWNVAAAAKARGLRLVLWSDFGWDVGSGRWQRGAEKIAAGITSSARPGDILLMHDGDMLNRGADKSSSVEAARRVIADLRARGLRFVTVSELAPARP